MMSKKPMKIVINPAYSSIERFIWDLPVIFDKEGEVIYEGRNILKRYRIMGLDLVVKSFKIPIIINRIAYTFFRKSKACRSYEYAFEIMQKGFETPMPIAYIEEYKDGLLYRSYFISEYNSTAVTMRGYMDGSISASDEMLRSFAEYTARLHEAGVLHIDYSPGNVLMDTNPDGTYRFYLIDINRLRFQEISRKKALQNFDRLALSESVLGRIAKFYAEFRNFNVEDSVYLMNMYSDQFFLKRSFEYIAKALKKEHGWKAVLFGPLQQYFFVRRMRLLFCSEKKKNCFFKKERDLYRKYIQQSDLRGAINRLNHYES